MNFKYFLCIIVLITASCNQTKKNFVQPEILNKNTGFDLTLLNFNEDVLRLLSHSLDTINNDYSIRNYKNVVYPTNEDLKKINSQKRVVYIDEKRVHFQSLELDSIVQFFDLYSNKIQIEVASDLSLKTCWASAKIYDTLKLNSTLHNMYCKYGNTIRMQQYLDEPGLKEENYGRINQYEGAVDQEEYEVLNLESYLYEYHITPFDNYHQWNLKDRIVQIKISEEREFEIDLITGEYNNVDYYGLEFLVTSKKEYSLIKKTLVIESTKNNYPMRIIKPYYIEELDFYTHFGKYLVDETKEGKKYDFSR